MSAPSYLEWATVVLGSGVVGAGVTGMLNRRKTKADASKSNAEAGQIDADAARIIADTAVVLVAPLRTQVESLTARVNVLESENRNTKTLLSIALAHIEELHEWIKTHMPAAIPPSRPSSLPSQENVT